MSNHRIQNEVRVRQISSTILEDLKSIAEYYGKSVGEYVKHEIINIVKNTPEHIRRYRQFHEESEKNSD